jgi:hypothetical protein
MVLVQNTLSEPICKRLLLCPHVFSSETVEWLSVKYSLKVHVTCVEGIRSAYEVLVRKPESRRPHGTLEFRWECNIKIYLKEVA